VSWLGEERHSRPKLQKKELRDSKTSELKNSEKKKNPVLLECYKRLSKYSRASVEERARTAPKQTKIIY
jgi:hypothetical protein